MGWSTYFVFILAAINTLTVTYFLAIDNYPSLKAVFPSFELYILITISIGTPLLILVGYSHYKKTLAYTGEKSKNKTKNYYFEIRSDYIYNHSMSCKVSFIGLGVMGYPMAGYISKAGHNVTVYNRTKSKAEKWFKEYNGKIA